MAPAPATMWDLMARVGEKARLLPPPDCYLWRAVWWHLHSCESMVPNQAIGYALNQLRLARDMAARPLHYLVKPPWLSDWQWSQQ